MYVTGKKLYGEEYMELGLRAGFMTLLYGVIAYRIEVLSKQAFMGRESSEKAFHRWMKIFETFPEGIALIRNNYLLYGNKSLKFILNTGTDRIEDDDPYYETLRDELKFIVVK